MIKTLRLAWRHSDYALARGVHSLPAVVKELKITRGDSVYDFGCGDGADVDWLRSYGADATGVDIVDIYDEVTVYDITMTGADLLPVDFGLCFGVMDHIPEKLVPVTLSNISSLVTGDLYFTIPIRDLGFNELFGRQVQQTIKPLGWWRNKLQDIGEVRIGQPSGTDWMTAHVRKRH